MRQTCRGHVGVKSRQESGEQGIETIEVPEEEATYLETDVGIKQTNN